MAPPISGRGPTVVLNRRGGVSGSLLILFIVCCCIVVEDIGQLWRCSVSWCTEWKGLYRSHPQETQCGDLVKTASLGKWFPPWTVTRVEWHTALEPKVSGISTDAALFSEHGAQLVHHYRVSGDCVAQAFMRGSYMVDLLYFTNRACADAHWAAKRNRNSGTRSHSSPDQPVPLPQNVKQRTSEDEPPVRKAPRAESPVVSDASSQDGTLAVVSSEEYDALQVPQMCSASFGWRRQISPVSMPLPRFATQTVAPDIGQSSSVATQKYPSSPLSRS